MSRIFFSSFYEEITLLIQNIVSDPFLHALWINTLSYLENCGARKIASCEHPTAVKEEMLKHAAEEFRHAFFLKTQLRRVGFYFNDYSLPHLLGGWASYHYLDILDLHTSRYLRKSGRSLTETKQLSYLLVTYAIERRASELYPIYQSILRQQASKVQVQSILLEEKEHLQEMEQALHRVPFFEKHQEIVCHIEASACASWLKACQSSVLCFSPGISRT